MDGAGNYEHLSTRGRNPSETQGVRREELTIPAKRISVSSESPRGSAFFNSPVVFAALGMTASAFWLTGISYLGGTVSTIEKRMQLKSSESGLFPVVNDCFGLCTLLFVIHFGQQRHRPRIIAALYLIVSIGYFMHAVPHFLYELPHSLRLGENEYTNNTEEQQHGELCHAADTGTSVESCSADQISESGPLWDEAIWIVIGQALCSCGTCVYPLFITYLDDGVHHQSMGLYLGALFSTIAIGSAFGYGLATLCLQLPNFFTETGYDLPASPDDPRWLGNWWLGFIITGLCLLLSTIPIAFFPRHLPKPVAVEEETDSCDSDDYVDAVTHGLKSVGDEGPDGFLRGLFRSVWRIVTNLTVISLILCTTTLSGFIAGFQLFGAKYIQYEFSFEPDLASILIGLLLVPAGIFGNLIGGYIVKRYARGRHGLIKMVLCCALCVLVLSPTTLLFGCQNRTVAGLALYTGPENKTMVPNSNDSPEPPYEPQLTSECNVHCKCPVQYDPVCAGDVTYASPCHAGCQNWNYTVDASGKNTTIYYDCSCLMGNRSSSDPSYYPSAVQGECPKHCIMFIPYFIVIAIVMITGIMCANPVVLLEIRSVEKRDRSMTIAVGNFLGKMFGYIPGPIYYGAIIDTACRLFQTSCGKTGNCLLYDVVFLRFSFNGISLGIHMVATGFLLVAYYSISCQSRPRQNAPNKSANDLELATVS